MFKRSKLNKNINDSIDKLKAQHSVSEEELILLYDLENDPNEYSKFINGNILKYKNTYLTQPCIEYHFLLHHDKSIASPNKFRTAKDTEKELKKYLPNYVKGSSFIWSNSSIGLEEISLSKKRSIETFDSYSQMSFSTIGQLIKKHFKNK